MTEPTLTDEYLARMSGDCVKCKEYRKHIRELEAKYTALLEKLRELISDIDKLNELLRWDRDGWDAPESIVTALTDKAREALGDDDE